jgi:hypothetical protein
VNGPFKNGSPQPETADEGGFTPAQLRAAVAAGHPIWRAFALAMDGIKSRRREAATCVAWNNRVMEDSAQPAETTTATSSAVDARRPAR